MQEIRLDTYVKAAQIAGVPLCVCEFNIKQYAKDTGSTTANRSKINKYLSLKNLKSQSFGDGLYGFGISVLVPMPIIILFPSCQAKWKRVRILTI